MVLCIPCHRVLHGRSAEGSRQNQIACVRLTPETKAGWEAAAKAAGCSLSEWVKRCCARELGSPPGEQPPITELSLDEIDVVGIVDTGVGKIERPIQKRGGYQPTNPGAPPKPIPKHQADPKDKAAQEHARGPKKKTRTHMCEHRVAAGSFCKRCDT